MHRTLLIVAALLCPAWAPTAIAQTTSPSDLPSDTLAFSLPKMAEVAVRHEAYREADGRPLTMDIYYPQALQKGTRPPVVLFVMGYSDASPVTRGPLKDMSAYVSWGRLTAAAGMIGVTYQTLRPEDTEAVLAHLRNHAGRLGIDADRIGLWSCSANSPAAVSLAMQEGPPRFRFAVFYYGLMLSPDNWRRKEIDGLCASRGCYAAGLKDVASLRTDLPLLIARAGRDNVPFVNDSIDHFADLAKQRGVPMTLVDYDTGVHGFDQPKQPDPTASDIIQQTLDFMKKHFGNRF